MSIDDAVDKAAIEIDRLLEARYRDLELRMFGDGASFDGIEAVVELQREADAAWRVKALAQVREWLIAAGAG